MNVRLNVTFNCTRYVERKVERHVQLYKVTLNFVTFGLPYGRTLLEGAAAPMARSMARARNGSL